MTWDERLHWLGGYFQALPYRLTSLPRRLGRIQEIDQRAFDREWSQNLKGKDPNPTLSDHQMREARAWGNGARRACGASPPWPACYDLRRPA